MTDGKCKHKAEINKVLPVHRSQRRQLLLVMNLRCKERERGREREGKNFIIEACDWNTDPHEI